VLGVRFGGLKSAVFCLADMSAQRRDLLDNRSRCSTTDDSDGDEAHHSFDRDEMCTGTSTRGPMPPARG
jgi:hypothetical protein